MGFLQTYSTKNPLVFRVLIEFGSEYSDSISNQVEPHLLKNYTLHFHIVRSRRLVQSRFEDYVVFHQP